MTRAGAAFGLVSAILAASCERTPPASKHDVESPQAAIDRLDSRQPVPLLPMMAEHQKRTMRDHLVAVQEMTAALAIGDFAGVERAAERVGTSQQMKRMCEHLGAHAPGFTDLALTFHETADTIIAAAKQADRDGVLSALHSTLAKCTACHSTYKQQVVDDATWARLERAHSTER